ncbi:hypothetical protein GCM10011351_17830 [Paraliobacillus quinghaiensis]|uniref:Zinc-ribbon domain-containing protein n=1 Tax=Paraliobacillus quinghaiensis TaxID=470815 RepID=A0A917TQA9_9BACI|nr:zinc ribbon domain-containing protein [Paraliobacillus quinghaiensis]GGM32096.1 hypothetical protein GCM10011351_17830 [Paraliobacillus quinghaiensis]
MNCPNCQAALEENAKFCTNCGTKINEENVAHVATSAQHTETAQHVPNQQEQTGDYVQQGKQISKQYWNFILQAMAHPFEVSKKVREADKVNGMITLALFSLFVPLFTYITIHSLSGGYLAPTFTDVVLKPFIIFLIFFALLIAVKFGVAKLMKANVSFIDVMTRFGTLMVLPTAVAMTAVLFAILDSYTFSSILLLLAISTASMASTATIFSLKTKAPATSGLDVYYGVVLTYVAMAIILLLIGDSILGNLINEMQRGFYGIPF